MDNSIGVSSYLIGQSKVEEIIQKTFLENLDIISAGPIPPNPAELISKIELIQLIEELKERYDYVVVDTPPLGIVADALIIMKITDINVYIVREGVTKKGTSGNYKRAI